MTWKHTTKLGFYGSSVTRVTTGSKLKAAIKENRKLRAMVAGHFQVARSLQLAIDEQMRLRAQKLSWPNSAAASDELIFALLDEEKERQYAALDKVLEESGIACVFHPLCSSLQFQQSANGVSFQHNEVRMLPFGVAEVARSLHHCLSYGSRVGPSKHCRTIEMYDKYFHAVTADNVELPETQPTQVNSRVLQLCVTKPKQTVVMWSGYVEYEGSKFIRLLEKTWIVMESIPLEKLGMFTMREKTHGTLMRVVGRLTSGNEVRRAKDRRYRGDGECRRQHIPTQWTANVPSDVRTIAR